MAVVIGEWIWSAMPIAPAAPPIMSQLRTDTADFREAHTLFIHAHNWLHEDMGAQLAALVIGDQLLFRHSDESWALMVLTGMPVRQEANYFVIPISCLEAGPQNDPPGNELVEIGVPLERLVPFAERHRQGRALPDAFESDADPEPAAGPEYVLKVTDFVQRSPLQTPLAGQYVMDYVPGLGSLPNEGVLMTTTDKTRAKRYPDEATALAERRRLDNRAPWNYETNLPNTPLAAFNVVAELA